MGKKTDKGNEDCLVQIRLRAWFRLETMNISWHKSALLCDFCSKASGWIHLPSLGFCQIVAKERQGEGDRNTGTRGSLTRLGIRLDSKRS